MDLDKVIKETRDCIWQLQKLDIEDKYESYSMNRLLAEIAAETKRMNDAYAFTARVENAVEVSAIQYQENMNQNKVLRTIDEKLSGVGIYQGIRAGLKKIYRFFSPYRTVEGKELLKNDGEVFARVAYKSILLREIDREALENTVYHLENHKLTKVGFLNSLCKSEEGRIHGIAVKGLRWMVLKENLKKGIKRIPVVGYALRWVKCIVMLPRMLTNVQNSINDLVLLEQRMTKQLTEQQTMLNALRRDLEFAVRDQNEKMLKSEKVLEESWKQELSSLHKGVECLREDGNRKTEMLLEKINKNALEVRKVDLWREEQVRRELGREANMLRMKNLLDAFYVDYNEKLMCDSREEVAERQKQYLPFIEQQIGNNKEKAVIIDLGCGEGEFVEVLNQHNYPAYGVDSNPLVIEKVKEINPSIRIEMSDATKYLAGLKDNSVDFLSCFHVVEHLEPAELLELLQEMHRVLKVGGGLILETPNPLNILISTYYFYMDPTHKKQIPPELLKLMVSSTGFKIEECRMLRPLNFVPYSYDDPEDKIRDIVFRFNMEQAYSIMAVKE